MKISINKNAKRVLSLTLALVMILGTLFVANVGVTLSASAATVEDTWDGTFVEPTEKDAAGNIIINNAEELAWIALQGGTATQGKNYKVVENAIFNLNGMAGITLDSTAADVEAATKTSKWGLATDSTSPAFGGNFDGNGLIVYNASGKKLGYNGLFPVTCPVSGGSVTIKNITVVASDFRGYHNAGAIVGLANAPDTSTSLYLENCVVKNCFISDGADGNTACQRTTGTHIGNAGHNKTAVNNCLAIGNKLSGQDINGGFVGNVSGYNTGLTVSNSISIGTNPVSTPIIDALSAKYANAVFTNVYTDQTVSKTGVTTLTTAQMTGDAAKDNMALAWGVEWFEGKTGEYPSINGEVYADTWDGTKVQPTETDSDGNVIINTAEELAWIALEGGSATNGVNYKVADGLKYFNMNGMAGITINSTVADVQAAAKTYQMRWIQNADSSTAHAFGGNFDGNGLTVFNISAGAGGGQGYTGLFPVTRQSADGMTQEIKNIQVVASYFVGYHYAGAIVGNANAPGTSCVTNISNIMVKNCYITDNANTNAATNRNAATVVGNAGHNKTTLNNCLVANTTTVGTNVQGGFVGNSSQYSKGIAINNSIMIGNTTHPVDILDDSKIIEAPAVNATCTNVYSDQATSQSGVTTIDAADAKGAGADEKMPNLGWGIDWFTGAPGEYPCFVDDGVEYAPDEIEALLVENGYYSDFVANFANNYNRDSFTTSDEDCNFYATGLTLKTNAYLTVTFAFLYDYRENKDDIEAVFKVGNQTITVKGNEMINNEGAGRYHMVRLKGISVANLCEDITVTLKYNGTVIGSGNISVAGFGFTANDAGEGFEHYESAAHALVFYAEALQRRAALR